MIINAFQIEDIVNMMIQIIDSVSFTYIRHLVNDLATLCFTVYSCEIGWFLLVEEEQKYYT